MSTIVDTRTMSNESSRTETDEIIVTAMGNIACWCHSYRQIAEGYAGYGHEV